jgi:hypothetical protein
MRLLNLPALLFHQSALLYVPTKVRLYWKRELPNSTVYIRYQD